MPQDISCSPNALDQTQIIQIAPIRDRRAVALSDAADEVVAHNGEVDSFVGTWPTSFSKGLPHDVNGIVDGQAFSEFVEEISEPTYTDNSGNRVALFDMPAYRGPFRTKSGKTGTDFSWRAWSTAVSGPGFRFGGAECATVGIAPAPRLGSDELAAEMAELYAMALLRDVPFEETRKGLQGADQIAAALANMAWFDPEADPKDADGGEIGKVSVARRKRDGENLTPQTLFRGSSRGCAEGPYLSQFLLQGSEQLAQRNGRRPTLSLAFSQGPGPMAEPSVQQRIQPQVAGVDYLRDWAEWLDVQNGADAREEQELETGREKFIETPRDLASLVHFGSVSQAHVNACQLLLAWGAEMDDGLPRSGRAGQLDPYADWGSPHALTLLAEAANRAMRAIRQHTFHVHHRARPEKLGSVASLIANGHGSVLGLAEDPARAHLHKLEGAVSDGYSLLDAVAGMPSLPRFAQNVNTHNGLPVNDRNLLLPIAYAEGSPMHPSYGAGHAAVAGACVTVLKAFFRTHAEDWSPVSLAQAGAPGVFVPEQGGDHLIPAEHPGDTVETLTLNGELNKLAANVAIGRSLAGVHYYSDYFDSVRMGERIAVGLLAEQMAAYAGTARMSLESYDGDRLTITGSRMRGSEIHVQDSSSEQWWTRHLPEQAGW